MIFHTLMEKLPCNIPSTITANSNLLQEYTLRDLLITKYLPNLPFQYWHFVRLKETPLHLNEKKKKKNSTVDGCSKCWGRSKEISFLLHVDTHRVLRCLNATQYTGSKHLTMWSSNIYKAVLLWSFLSRYINVSFLILSYVRNNFYAKYDN